MIVRGLRFRLTDPFGASALPDVMPTPTAPAATIPSSTPIPIPSAPSLPSSPIPIPGVSPIGGLFVPAASSRPFPFFLKFGCGIAPEGTLFIEADATDRDGRPNSPHVRVRVGR